MADLRFRPRAKQDLERIYDFVADFAGGASARGIVAAIEAYKVEGRDVIIVRVRYGGQQLLAQDILE